MKEINKLVFSGGGIRGLVFIGVIKKLEELIKYNDKKVLININSISAVSAGSVIALMYLLGYSYIEMLEISLTKNFDSLKDIKIMDFINKYGLDSGNNVISWFSELMIKKNIKNDITLKEFYNKTNINFQIITSNLNRYCLKNFNYIDTPNVKVLDAIRMSISIPLVFTKKLYEDEIHVDGGLINNYPIEVFEDNLDNVLGFKLISSKKKIKEYNDINDIQSFIYNIFGCYQLQKKTKQEKYKHCTVYIDTKELTNSLDFNITPFKKNQLIQIGYSSIDEYLKTN